MVLSEELDLDFHNYPGGSTDGIVRDGLVFGSGSTDFAMLIEFSPDSDGLRVTVGNGPPHPDAPVALAEMLRSIAEIIEDLGDRDEYWEAINELDDTE